MLTADDAHAIRLIDFGLAVQQPTLPDGNVDTSALHHRCDCAGTQVSDRAGTSAHQLRARHVCARPGAAGLSPTPPPSHHHRPTLYHLQLTHTVPSSSPVRGIRARIGTLSGRRRLAGTAAARAPRARHARRASLLF